jgi:hypothetical protein
MTWPVEVEHLRKIWWEGKADKLEANLEKLRLQTETKKEERNFEKASLSRLGELGKEKGQSLASRSRSSREAYSRGESRLTVAWGF